MSAYEVPGAGLAAGRLRHRITLQQAAVDRNADGSERKTWQDVATVWAAIATDSGREFARAKAVNAELTHEIGIRWRKGVRPSMRVLYRDVKEDTTRYFDIRAVINADERSWYLALHCRELIGREAQS